MDINEFEYTPLEVQFDKFRGKLLVVMDSPNSYWLCSASVGFRVLWEVLQERLDIPDERFTLEHYIDEHTNAGGICGSIVDKFRKEFAELCETHDVWMNGEDLVKLIDAYFVDGVTLDVWFNRRGDYE